MSRALCTLAVLSILATSACAAGKRADLTQQTVQSSALNEIPLPFHGVGVISVLDSGEVAVGIVNEKIEVVSEEGEPLKRERVVEVEETFFLQCDAKQVRLCGADGQWFLDKNGKMLNARGLDRNRVTVLDFHDLPIDPAEAAYSLMDFTGELTIQLLRDAGTYIVRCCDQVTGECFTTSFAVLPRGLEAGARQEPEEEARREGCSATCSHGSCQIDCTRPLIPKCYCTANGVPKCACVTRGDLIEMDPIDPGSP